MILTDRAWQLTLTSLFLLNVSSGGSTRSSNGEASLTAFGLIAKKHINGIVNFWNQAKRVLRKYNGIPRKNFFLFMKEWKFRFNHGYPEEQIKTLRKWAQFLFYLRPFILQFL